jgi:kinesin family protein C2/C3
VRELQQRLKEAEQNKEMSAELKIKNKQQEEELARIDREKAEQQQKYDTLSKDLKAVGSRHSDNQKRMAATESLSRNLVVRLNGLSKDVVQLKDSQKQVKSDCDGQLRYIADRFPILKGRMEMLVSEIDHIETKHREIGEERKRLHNLVLELKGNIRVFVRVRPISQKEQETEPKETTITFAEDSKVSVWSEEQSRRKWFEFDQCFKTNSSNRQVFEEVKPLAISVLDGYNVCIFAYGQTGSGKTYTMSGTDRDPGLNVLTLKELFRISTERKLDIETKMTIMVTEIYNEMIKDLLGGKNTLSKKLDVKINADGTTTVPGLTETAVGSVEEVLKCMEQAQANRTTMQTDMNDESSRSHSIVQVKTVVTHKKDAA